MHGVNTGRGPPSLDIHAGSRNGRTLPYEFEGAPRRQNGSVPPFNTIADHSPGAPRKEPPYEPFLRLVLASASGCAGSFLTIQQQRQHLGELERERVERLARCEADCSAHFGEWGDFTDRVPSDAWLDSIKNIWAFQAELDRVFGPQEPLR